MSEVSLLHHAMSYVVYGLVLRSELLATDSALTNSVALPCFALFVLKHCVVLHFAVLSFANGTLSVHLQDLFNFRFCSRSTLLHCRVLITVHF